jgi:hypothetical protein
MAALERTRGGEVISLAPGTYTGVGIRNFHRDTPVVITGKGAKLSGLTLDGASGLTFKQVEFFVSQPGQFAYRVNSSRNIKFNDVYVHGILDGNPQGKPSGISIIKSSNIVVENSIFEQLRRGIGVASSREIVIRDSVFKSLQTDGIMVSDTVGIKITGNKFSDFYPVEGDHPDAIQFLTAGTKSPSKDILISNNIAMRNAGKGIQGIFMKDEKGTLPYENVEISGNILVGTGYNGIAIEGGKGIHIHGNQLLSYEGKTNQNWILVRRADGVRIIDNSAVKFGYVDVANLEERGNKKNKPVPEKSAAEALSKLRTQMR